MPDEKKPYDPYFIAVCECGCVGPGRDSLEQASGDAYEHSPSVKEEVYRPVA
jgi:hypothetical protein